MKHVGHVLVMSVFTLMLAGCSGTGQAPVQDEQQSWSLPVLPDIPRVASITSIIDGSAHDATGGDVMDDPPAVVLNATEITAAWALYSFGMPAGGSLTDVTLDVEDVSGEYWAGLADYGGRNAWEWHGPFSDDAVVTPAGEPGNYLSPTDNVHWVVVAPRDSSLRLPSSTVDYEQGAIFHVPPPGTQVAVPTLATSPSLILMSADTPTAEPGAPVIFYFGGEAANTYYAYYDGETWVQRLALPDGPVITHPVARGYIPMSGSDATHVLLTAYDAVQDKPYLYGFDEALVYQGWPSEPKATGTGILTMLAMECQDQAIWVLAEVRTTGDDAQITAVYDDLTDSIKPVYQETHTAEEVAGIDVIYHGGQPTIAYSHGTIDTSEAVLLDFAVTVAKPGGTTWWNTFPADYGAPLSLDLGLSDKGDLQMLFIAGSDFDIIFPIDFHATLFYDVVVGSYISESWSYDEIFTSKVNIEILYGTMDPDWGINASWAGSDALSYSHVDGTIEFSLSPSFEITGGELTNHVHLLERPSGSFVDGPDFNEPAGVAFSWGQGPSGLSSAYIHAEQVDIEELLGGQVEASGDLLYWSTWQ